MEIRPLLDDLQPVAANLADPQTRLARLFAELGDAAAETAPVAETQAALFGNMATTFGALAGVAPFLQDFISERPPTLDVGIREFPRQRPFLRNSAAFFRELRPGIRTLPASAPVLADAFRFGIQTLPRTPQLNRRLASLFEALAEFAEDPVVPRGVEPDRLHDALAASAGGIPHAGPDALQLRDAARPQRSPACSPRATPTAPTSASSSWPRRSGANNEGGPSSRPAGDGPANTENNLHINPYPNTASPGQTAECEAGNEDYVLGRTSIGNVPGNQGGTAGQGGADAAAE